MIVNQVSLQASEAPGYLFWVHLLGSTLWGRQESGDALRREGGESRNSFTRLSVTREGLACGLLAIIHSNLVRMDFLSATI